MRLLFSKKSKKELFNILKDKHNCNSIKELSYKIKISKKTLQGWFYDQKRYLPENIIDKNMKRRFEILDEKEDNWGQIKGGKKIYNLTIREQGIKEIKRRQALGGKRAAETKSKFEERNFSVCIKDPLFLEFYGALLGDGWISKNTPKNKWMIGLCGNLSLDKSYILYMNEIIKKLFNRNGNLSERAQNNTIQFIFRHKLLFKFMTEKLNFPIGKKRDLQIYNKIYGLDFNLLKKVIRGIFDTDGSFFLCKNRSGVSNYPRISIHMNSPLLIKQIGDVLMNNGFKVGYSDKGKMINLNGKKQLSKWIKEIGSSNKKHIDRITNFIVNSKEYSTSTKEGLMRIFTLEKYASKN